jgi:hypothetical protein
MYVGKRRRGLRSVGRELRRDGLGHGCCCVCFRVAGGVSDERGKKNQHVAHRKAVHGETLRLMYESEVPADWRPRLISASVGVLTKPCM